MSPASQGANGAGRRFQAREKLWNYRMAFQSVGRFMSFNDIGLWEDLQHEISQRAIAVLFAVLVLAYGLSLTSASVWTNIPVAFGLLLLLRRLSLNYEIRWNPLYHTGNPIQNQRRTVPQLAPNGPLLSFNLQRTSKRQSAWKAGISAPAVETAVDLLTRAVVKEWVTNLWYRMLTPDEDFPEELRLLLNRAIAEVAARVKKANLVTLLTRNLVELFGHHLEVYRMARDQLGQSVLDSLSASEQDERLRETMLRGGVLHPGLSSPQAEYHVLRRLMGGVVTSALKSDDVQCRLLRTIARELLASAVVRPLMSLTSPALINELILAMVAGRKQPAKKGHTSAEGEDVSAERGGTLAKKDTSAKRDTPAKGANTAESVKTLEKDTSASEDKIPKGKMLAAGNTLAAGDTSARGDTSAGASMSAVANTVAMEQATGESASRAAIGLSLKGRSGSRQSSSADDVSKLGADDVAKFGAEDVAKFEKKKTALAADHWDQMWVGAKGKRQRQLADERKRRALGEDTEQGLGLKWGDMSPPGSSTGSLNAFDEDEAEGLLGAVSHPRGSLVGANEPIVPGIGWEKDDWEDPVLERMVGERTPVGEAAEAGGSGATPTGVTETKGRDPGRENGTSSVHSTLRFASKAADPAAPPRVGLAKLDVNRMGVSNAPLASTRSEGTVNTPQFGGPEFALKPPPSSTRSENGQPQKPSWGSNSWNEGGEGSPRRGFPGGSPGRRHRRSLSGGLEGLASEDAWGDVSADVSKRRRRGSFKGDPSGGLHQTSWEDGGESNPTLGGWNRVLGRVVGARMEQSEGKAFAVYTIAVADSGRSSWLVERRYRNFEALHRALKDLPQYKLQLPPKRYLAANLDNGFVAERRGRLDRYLQTLLAIPSVAESHEVWDFLSADSHAYGYGRSSSMMKTIAGNMDDVFDAMFRRLNAVSDELQGAITKGLKKAPTLTDSIPGLSRQKPLPKNAGPVEVPMADHAYSGVTSRDLREDGEAGYYKPEMVKVARVLKEGGATHAGLGGSLRDEGLRSAVSTDGEVSLNLPNSRNWTSAQRADLKIRGGDVDALRQSDTGGSVESEDEGEETPLQQEWQGSKLSAPLLNLVDQVFQLQQKGWLRRQVVWMARQILEIGLGDAIDDFILTQIQWLRQPEILAAAIDGVRALLWPNGVWFANQPGPATCQPKDHPVNQPGPATCPPKDRPVHVNPSVVRAARVGAEQTGTGKEPTGHATISAPNIVNGHSVNRPLTSGVNEPGVSSSQILKGLSCQSVTGPRGLSVNGPREGNVNEARGPNVNGPREVDVNGHPGANVNRDRKVEWEWAPVPPQPTFEERLEVARKAALVRELFLDSAPAALVSLIGSKQYKRCARDVYSFIQSPVCVKQLAFGVLELLIEATFPELEALIQAIRSNGAQVELNIPIFKRSA